MIRRQLIFDLVYNLWCSSSLCSPRFPIFSTIAWDHKVILYSWVNKSTRDMYLEISDHGFLDNDNHDIIINDSVTVKDQRFTAAHELGHFLLGHQKNNILNEAEANFFASCLLCPFPIADFFGLSSAEQYEQVFDVPKEWAHFAFENAEQTSRFIPKCQSDYIKNLMNLYMRNYIYVSDYWKDVNQKIYRNVSISNHPLYSWDNLPIILQTLQRMEITTPVINNSGTSIIPYPFFAQALASHAIDSTWHCHYHSPKDDYHPFIMSYRYGY